MSLRGRGLRVVFVKNVSLISRKSRSSILICYDPNKCRETNVRDIEALVMLGSEINVKSGVISLLSSFNVPVVVISKLGTAIFSAPVVTLYNEVRRRQYIMTDEEREEIMLNVLFAKFRGFANVLRYYGFIPPEIVELRGQGVSVLQWEAVNSRVFWSEILKLLPPNVLEELKLKYGFEGRRPRAVDPFNKSVSLLYALLYAICLRALLASGLDPTYGLHHKTRYSTPLVYDYSEMFKPLAVHAVIKAFKARKILEVGEDGELTKESVNAIAEEFFKLIKARIQGTRYTIQRLIYINAFRLADRIKGNANTNYTFTYNPKKLKIPQ